MSNETKTYPNTKEHIEKGDWNPVWDLLKEMDPDFLEAYPGSL